MNSGKQRRVGKDPNMDTALKWGRMLISEPGFWNLPPPNIIHAADIAKVVNEMDGMLVQQNLLRDLHPVEFLKRITRIINHLTVDCYIIPSSIASNTEYWTSILLRLWAGCISGAKIIALETRSGPNTPKYRLKAIKSISKVADIDKVYEAGIKAATAFKILRNQPYSFEGIPQEYMNRYWSLD